MQRGLIGAPAANKMEKLSSHFSKFINSLGKGAGTRFLVNTADPFSSFFTRNKATVTTESTESLNIYSLLTGSQIRKAAPTPGCGEARRGRGALCQTVTPVEPPGRGQLLQCHSSARLCCPAPSQQLALTIVFLVSADVSPARREALGEQAFFPLGSLLTPSPVNEWCLAHGK